ncbi:MAG: protein-disulfide reductase DsbD domain-containing protein [Myxococcota bacterium]
MTRKSTLPVVLVVGLLGCTSEPPSTSPPTSTAVEAPSFEGALTATPRFDAGWVVVDLQLRPGFHVYTTGETTGRPIRLELDVHTDWTSDGEAVYPEGKRKKTALGESVVVEGSAEARLKIRATSKGPGEARGVFHYQVCTDHACDRPRKLQFAVGPPPT